MDDLLADFIAETREMLEAIGGEVVAWEAEPTDRARLDAIFRFVHTVKGNCGFFDFPRLEALAHAAESALAEVRSGHRQANQRLVNGVLAVIDRIADLVSAIEAGESLDGDGDDPLIAALEPSHDDDQTLPLAGTDATPSARAADKAQSLRTIRLPVELLDRLMSGVSDMVLARNDLARRLRDVGNQPSIDGPFERLSSILDDVREGVTRMRMQRIEYLYGALPRLVRDLSAELGKQVLIDLEGGDVELDREMIETIRDPITHIIRNAIDHGIERPADRLAVGKREIGLLSIAARQAGNKISLLINDDGRGLEIDKIVAKAIASGIATQDEIESMGRRQKLDLIFEAGLSTADEVSAISGRGVGMDVVRSNLEKVGGSINVDSEPGEGTMFFLQLPLTLSIIAGLTVHCDGRRFAIPRSYIEEIARGSSSAVAVEEIGETAFVTFRGARVPCLRLSTVLGLDDTVSFEEGVFVFVRLASGDLFALLVDGVIDNEDLVVKPLAPAIMATGIYAGSTLLDDGNPILMLDVPNIAYRNGLVSQIRVRKAAVDEGRMRAADRLPQVILFRSLTGKRRAMRMDPVIRIEQVPVAAIGEEGGHYSATLDGAILPVAGFDQGIQADGQITALRLGDGAGELLYAVGEIENTADLEGDIAPEDGDPLLEGTALFAGVTAGVIDIHALFAAYGRKAAPARKPVCRLPEDDEWSRHFLTPLIETAGYRAVYGDEHRADIVIATDDHPSASEGGVPVVRLSTSHELAHECGAIYRYDRDAVLAALRNATGRAKHG